MNLDEQKTLLRQLPIDPCKASISATYFAELKRINSPETCWQFYMRWESIFKLRFLLHDLPTSNMEALGTHLRAAPSYAYQALRDNKDHPLANELRSPTFLKDLASIVELTGQTEEVIIEHLMEKRSELEKELEEAKATIKKIEKEAINASLEVFEKALQLVRKTMPVELRYNSGFYCIYGENKVSSADMSWDMLPGPIQRLLKLGYLEINGVKLGKQYIYSAMEKSSL